MTSNFSVSWDQYNKSICSGLQQLQQHGEFVDMTLAADGHLVKVHQLVISLASPYLRDIIRSLSTPHPVIFLNDVSHKVLCQILEYIYTGEAIIPAGDFKQFVATGKALHVKGISDMMIEDSILSQVTAQPEETINTTLESFYEDDNSTAQRKRTATEPKTTLPLLKKIKLADLRPIGSQKQIVDHNEISIADDDGADNYDSNDDNSEPIISTLEKKDDQLKPTLMFSKSNKGGLQVILNRFIYYLVHTYKDGRRRWECVDNRTNKCKAFVVTDGNKIINRFNSHIHPRHDKKIMKKVKSGCVYTSVENVNDDNVMTT